MSGMITTGDTNVSTYGSRTVAIEVTGVCHQDIARTSNYTLRVPYSRMSQTIQNISRIGGKVAGVSLDGITPTAVETNNEISEETTEKKSSGKRKNRNRK